jgi:hypothetical protein
MHDTIGVNGAGDAAEPTPAKVEKTDAYRKPVEAKELLRADAGDLKADNVTMDRSGAESITADRVTMDRSGARKLDAKSAHFENSGAVVMTAENAVFYGGAAVAVKAKTAKIVHSNFVALKTEQATIEGQVNALLYAGPADAKVNPVFTPGSAATFGVGLAAGLLMLGRLLRRLIGRG